MGIYRKIAIVGTVRSGKTVFLTSLINHLEEHDSMDFVVGTEKSIKISDFKVGKIPKRIGGQFNYLACRDALVNNGRWPSKTKDTSHFLCSFKRSDWSKRNELHFFDFPGERLADAAIARFDNFSDWSDYILEYIAADKTYSQIAEEYLSLQSMDSQAIGDNDLLSIYRKTLAKFVFHFKPMVTPSTFLLDQEGNTPYSSTIEGFTQEALSRPLGLRLLKNGKSGEFAPLPEIVRKQRTKLTKMFSEGYKEYREKVVLPLFTDLKTSNRLILLVDIPSLLNGGVAMYNDNREIVENLFNILTPDSWFWRILTDPQRLFSAFISLTFVPKARSMRSITNLGKIDRIAFVGTKSDAVHPTDVENGNLVSLLRQMTNKFANALEDDVEKDWFACSAVVSAKEAEGEQMMRGALINSPGRTDDEEIFKVPKLPERWPGHWTEGEYKFPSVLPRVPSNKGLAPEHYKLDRVFTFITED